MATEQQTGTDGGDDEQPLDLTVASGAVAAAVVVPLLWFVRTALSVGFAEAIALVTRPATAEVFLNSAVLVTLVIAACIGLGVPLAYLTVRTGLSFRRFWTVVISLPLATPNYIGMFAFVSASGPQGAFQWLLAPFGIESLPEIYRLPGVVLVLALYTYPYVFITTRATLKSVDTTLIDATRTLNHSRWEVFKRMTVPQIRSAVVTGLFLAALYVLSDFGTLTVIRFDAFTRVIYVEFGTFDHDTTTLLSFQLVAVTLPILTLESKIRGDERTTTGGRPEAPMPLGRWKYPAFGFVMFVATVALLVPLGVPFTWLAQGVAAASGSLAFQPEYALDSVLVTAAAAGAATLTSLPVAYLTARHSPQLSSVFERATCVGYTVPGVVLGLALVFLGSSYATPIYQTLYFLVLAHVVHFPPQAIGSLRASFLRVDPALPEATRTLGETPSEAFRHATLPFVTPSLFGGVALIFLTTVKELPATLLPRPSEFSTLVTHVWTACEQDYFGQAVVPTSILLFVSGLSMPVTITQEEYDIK